MNTERKLADARLRTLSAQKLGEVVGGDEYLHYWFQEVHISR